MKYGARGFGMLLTIEAESADQDAVDSELAEGINENGDYVSEAGRIYRNYIVVKGTEVYYRDRRIGNAEELKGFLEDKKIDTSSAFYIVDGYAASTAYKEVINVLSESGFEYEMD